MNKTIWVILGKYEKDENSFIHNAYYDKSEADYDCNELNKEILDSDLPFCLYYVENTNLFSNRLYT